MGWERHLSQYNQIGNAVCPPVAQAIGVALIEALKTAESREICSVASFILLSDSLKNPTLDCEHSTSDREDFENLRLSLAAADRILIQEHNLDGILVVGDEIKWNGYLLPLGVIWFSIMVIRDNACDICKRESPPFGVHGGSIQLLISKEDLVSLVRKERDHGLDYHLRKSFNCEMHLADSVAAILTAMGLGTVSLLPNPRTGKPGRAITISTELHPPSEVATLYHAWKENYKAGLELGKTVTADILSV